MIDDLQQPQDDTEDQMLESLAALREQRRGGATPAPDPAPAPAPARSPQDPPEPSSQNPDVETVESAGPAPSGGIESAPWFSALPPEAQDQLRKFSQKDAELAKAQQELARLNQGFAAMQGRLAPTQRQLADAQRRLAQFEQAQAQARTAPQVRQTTDAEFQAWVAKQPEHIKRQFANYPEDTRALFDIAQERAREERSKVEEDLARLRQEMQQSIERERTQSALRELRARHPDLDAFRFDRDATTGQPAPRTEAGRAYLEWLKDQPEHIQAMNWSDSPDEVGAVLDVYKWEVANPEYRETLSLPDFQAWERGLTRREREMVYSEDTRERVRVLQGFWRDYEAARAETPEAKRAAELAAERQRQRQTVAPSIRSPQAPAAAAAARDPEEADIEAVAAMREHWRNRRK